jgi:hypothetical protein
VRYRATFGATTKLIAALAVALIFCSPVTNAAEAVVATSPLRPADGLTGAQEMSFAGSQTVWVSYGSNGSSLFLGGIQVFAQPSGRRIRTILSTTDTAFSPGFVQSGSTVWVSNLRNNSIEGFSLNGRLKIGPQRIGTNLFAMAQGNGKVYGLDDNGVIVFNGTSGRILARWPRFRGYTGDISFNRGLIYIGSGADTGGVDVAQSTSGHVVRRINIAAYNIASIGNKLIGGGDSSVWVANERTGHVTATYRVGYSPATYLEVGNNLFAGCLGTPAIDVIDLTTNTVVRRVTTSGSVTGLLEVGGSVWEIQDDSPAVQRIPLRRF